MKNCHGCRNDFYNGKNDVGVKECWSLQLAREVTRYRLDWWTAPTVPGAFREVQTFQCHHAPGKYLDHKALPEFAVALPTPQEDPNER